MNPARGLVDRRQVRALQIFDQAELQGLEIVEAAHHHGHVVQLRLLRRAPAPFARDDLVGSVFAANRPYQDRLQQTELLHRLDQHVQAFEAGARLKLARPQLADRQGERRPCRCRARHGVGSGRRRGSHRRLGRNGGGDIVVAECTDPLAALDIPNLLRQTGDTLESQERSEGLLTFRIRKA